MSMRSRKSWTNVGIVGMGRYTDDTSAGEHGKVVVLVLQI
jgi:hypothetical protein